MTFRFVFAGHGDVENGRGFLELADGRYFREDLEAMLGRIPAARAHVILDACNSVYMLASRKPGGTRFATPEEVQRSMSARLAHVGTFLSTSADAQVYEWSQIQSGVFSHAVRSGISGAADLDRDGRITYAELRAFVRIAAQGVPNPRFRPRVFARGPNDQDNEVLFDMRAHGGAKVALESGAERRLTVLDVNEVPLVDVRLEQGFAPTLFLPSGGSLTLVEREGTKPEKRTEIKTVVDGDNRLAANTPALPAIAARSSTRPFELLFAAPFGPRAVAQLPPKEEAENVYGVSHVDIERMGYVLDVAASRQHDRRIGGGLAGLGVGAVMGAFAIAEAFPPGNREPDGRLLAVYSGVGGIGLIAGLYQLAVQSKLEDRRDAFVRAKRLGPHALESAVLEADKEMRERAEEERTGRIIGGALLLATGAGLTGLGIYAKTTAEDDRQHFAATTTIGFGAGIAVSSIGLFFIRSEEERMLDLWEKESGALPSDQGKSSVTVKPVVGLGGVGLVGTF